MASGMTFNGFPEELSRLEVRQVFANGEEYRRSREGIDEGTEVQQQEYDDARRRSQHLARRFGF